MRLRERQYRVPPGFTAIYGLGNPARQVQSVDHALECVSAFANCGCAVAHVRGSYVSDADIGSYWCGLVDVRYASDSDQILQRSEMSRWATSGHPDSCSTEGH